MTKKIRYSFKYDELEALTRLLHKFIIWTPVTEYEKLFQCVVVKLYARLTVHQMFRFDKKIVIFNVDEALVIKIAYTKAQFSNPYDEAVIYNLVSIIGKYL